jgi:hypothetical protein
MVSLLCAVTGVSATAGAFPVGDIPTAGSVVDPHCFQCGSGSSMLDQSHPDLVPDLGPDPGLHEGRPSKLREKSSTLKREHLALQNMEFLNFLVGYFIPSESGNRIQIQPTQINADPGRSGSTTPDVGVTQKLLAFLLLVILLRFLLSHEMFLVSCRWWIPDYAGIPAIVRRPRRFSYYYRCPCAFKIPHTPIGLITGRLYCRTEY